MRIYLDTCSLQRPFDDRAQLRVRVEGEAVLAILALCASGKAELVASDAHRYENERNPHSLRREYMDEMLAVAAHFVPGTQTVRDRAGQYVAAGIKVWDAAHLASAVEARANYFCTSDDRLLKRGRAADTGITKVVTPLELIEELAS
jgi:hypothetical protein